MFSKNFSKVHPYFFSFPIILFEVVMAVGIFTSIVIVDSDKVVNAAYAYSLSANVSGQTVKININPSTQVSGLSLIIVNTNTNQPAANWSLGKGVSSVSWSGVPGNYRVNLVYILTDVAQPKTFSIAEQSQWNLNAPSSNNDTVIFTFSPESNGNIALWIKNSSGQLVKDSGALPAGQTSYVWNGAPAGSYDVAIGYGLTALTPNRKFRVDRKAIPISVDTSCGSGTWPRVVTVVHNWQAAQGSFSSQFLEISNNSTFNSGVQSKSISSTTKSAQIGGYDQESSYYWRIKSTTVDGKVIFSRVQGFTTGRCPNPIPQVPTPLGVTGLPLCVNVGEKFGQNLTFSWTGSSGATSYRVRLTKDVNTGGDFAIKTVNSTTAGGIDGWTTGGNALVTWVSGDDLAMSGGVTYYFAVEAIGSGGSSGFDLVGKSYKIGPVNECLINLDRDGDGFSDKTEAFMGTDPNKSCGTASWPPDFNDDKRVTSIDISLITRKIPSQAGDSNYLARFDLNADSLINDMDRNLVADRFSQNCVEVLGIKSGRVLAAVNPGQLKIGTPGCSDVPYWMYARWDIAGDYWLDYTWDDWATYNNKHITGETWTAIPQGFASPYYVLFPGRTYKWRLWNGEQHFYGPDIFVTSCTSGVGASYSEVHDYIYGVGSNIYTDLPPGNGSKTLTRVELGKFLWGLSGCETGRTWNAMAGYPNGPYYGLYQYSQSSFTSTLKSMGLPTTISIYDAIVQTHGVIHNINLSHDRVAMLSSQWPSCGFSWNLNNNTAGW